MCRSFQSTHPLRGATQRPYGHGARGRFQSTHPLRGATRTSKLSRRALPISIHAPLAGCDSQRPYIIPGQANFNPRTPCGVRLLPSLSCQLRIYFNPRTPCGVRPSRQAGASRQAKISIHAPLAGCDAEIVQTDAKKFLFQSTHPLRGATAKLPKYSRQICEKATKFLQSQTKSGVAACWAKGKRPLFPALRGANLPGKPGTLPVRIRQSARPLARNRPWHRSAQRAFHTCCRDNKSAGCLFLCP